MKWLIELIIGLIKSIFGTNKPVKNTVEKPDKEINVDDGKTESQRLKELGLCFLLIFLFGCNLTLGPKVENKLIIVQPGVPVEILQNEELECRVLTDKDNSNVVKQDVGGWIAMPPAHWETLKKKFKELEKDN